MAEVSLIRLFIALPLPKEAQKALVEFQKDLPRQYFKPLSEENLHLTLAFLGDTPSIRVAEITELLREVGNHFQPYVCELSGMGAFPNPWEPRVVWAGIDVGSKESIEISELLRQALKKAKVSFDTKPFRPHITIAYARKHLNLSELREAGSIFTQMLSQRNISSPQSSRELSAPPAHKELKGASSSMPSSMPSKGYESATLKLRVSFRVTEITLVKSELKPQRAEHTPLVHVPLKGEK